MNTRGDSVQRAGRSTPRRVPWLCVVVAVLLGGCAGYQESNRIAKLSPAAIGALSDQEICAGRLYNPRNTNLLAAATNRGLGDCSAMHFRCVGAGHTYGTTAYATCRRTNAPAGLVHSVTGQNFVPVHSKR